MATGNAWATQESIYEVAQPIESDGDGLRISDVTFVTWRDTLDDPALLVCLTAWESRVATPGGFENRNVASESGIRIRPAPAPHPEDGPGRPLPGLFGDTLRVVLDVSGAQFPDWPAEAVMNLTVECMVRNAERRRRHPIRCLTVEVEGDSALAHWAGTHRLPRGGAPSGDGMGE